MTISGSTTDGSSFVFKATFPREGGAVKVQQGDVPQGFSWVETLVAPGEWYVMRLRDLVQILLTYKVFSKDGKMMRQTMTGTNAQGKTFEQIQVFDRQ